MNKTDLTEDQQLAIDRLYNFDETFLVAPTGAGKTVILLTAIRELLKEKVLSRVLVIAPLKVCLTTWANESKKWFHLESLLISFATGAPQERADAVIEDNDIVVVNEENVDWLFSNSFHTFFDGIVIDETSHWNHTGGKRFKKIRRKMKWFNWRVGMTAEPVSENWVQLFGQLLLIDLGKALGTSRDRYLRKYFYPTDWENRNWEVFADCAEEIAERISSLVHLMPDYKEELPEKRVTYHEIELEPEAWRRYNRMRIDSVLEVEDETIEASTKAVLSGKLEQIASGFSYIEDTEPLRGWIIHHEQKVDWVVKRAAEIVENNESVVIVYWFHAELDDLRMEIPEALTMGKTPKATQLALEKWKSAPGQIMLLHPASASHGVDGLQDTCHRQLWTGPIWSRDRTKQTEDRLWRRGQTHPVEIEVAIAKGTVDEVKRASVDYKGDHHDLFLLHLEEHIETPRQEGETQIA